MGNSEYFKVKDSVMELLKFRKSVTKRSATQQLAKKLDLSVITVNRYFDEMEASGVIKYSRSGAGNILVQANG